MAIAHARPEQSPLINSSRQAGLSAASAWFSQIQRTAADHRDTSRCAFMRALVADDSDAALASVHFNQGFAEGLVEALMGVRHG